MDQEEEFLAFAVSVDELGLTGLWSSVKEVDYACLPESCTDRVLP